MCKPSDSSVNAERRDGSAPTPEQIPRDAISQAMFRYAAEHLAPAILNHSIRVFFFAKAIGDQEDSEWCTPDRLHLLFTACILHDVGTIELHNGPLRFEVEGADAAFALLRQHQVSEADTHDVWVALAVHTSPQIAERIAPLARLVRLGVTVDFSYPKSMAYTTDATVNDLETHFPRLDIEKVLGDAVADQAVKRPEKAPAASWPENLYRSKMENPDWAGVNKRF